MTSFIPAVYPVAELVGRVLNDAAFGTYLKNECLISIIICRKDSFCLRMAEWSSKCLKCLNGLCLVTNADDSKL